MNTSRGILSFENRLLLVLFLVFGLVFLDRLALPFLWPQISQDLGLTNAHLGMLSSALALSWALAGAGLGYLADRLRLRRPFLLAAIVVFSLSSGLTGLVGGFALLMLLRLIMGLAEGHCGYHLHHSVGQGWKPLQPIPSSAEP